MRLLHCSDFHLGKQMRGHSRHSEHEAVLDQMVDIAASECVDAVLICGDVFDRAYADPESVRLFLDTVVRFRDIGADVVVIAGNHDAPELLDAWRALAGLGGVHIIGSVPADPQAMVVPLASGTVVALPWVPERYVLSWESLSERAGMVQADYTANVGAMLQQAGTLFPSAGPKVLMYHGYLNGSALSGPDGGERSHHTALGFAVRPFDLPAQAHYVALGHIHKAQQVPSHVPAYYSGSPLQLDFGEGGQQKRVRIADVSEDGVVDTWTVAITRGTPCTTVEFHLEAMADPEFLPTLAGNVWLRVRVRMDHLDPTLYQRVTAALPNAVAVETILPELVRETITVTGAIKTHEQMDDPSTLFSRYYEREYGQDCPPEMLALFTRLYEGEAGAKAKATGGREYTSTGKPPTRERWPVMVWPVPAGIEPYSPEHKAWSEATYVPYDMRVG